MKLTADMLTKAIAIINDAATETRIHIEDDIALLDLEGILVAMQEPEKLNYNLNINNDAYVAADLTRLKELINEYTDQGDQVYINVQDEDLEQVGEWSGYYEDKMLKNEAISSGAGIKFTFNIGNGRVSKYKVNYSSSLGGSLRSGMEKYMDMTESRHWKGLEALKKETLVDYLQSHGWTRCIPLWNGHLEFYEHANPNDPQKTHTLALSASKETENEQGYWPWMRSAINSLAASENKPTYAMLQELLQLQGQSSTKPDTVAALRYIEEKIRAILSSDYPGDDLFKLLAYTEDINKKYSAKV